METLVQCVKTKGIKIPKYVYYIIARQANLLFTMGWQQVKKYGYRHVLQQSALVDNLPLFKKVFRKRGKSVSHLFVRTYCQKSIKVLNYLKEFNHDAVFSVVCENYHKKLFNDMFNDGIYHNCKNTAVLEAAIRGHQTELVKLFADKIINKDEFIKSAFSEGNFEAAKILIEDYDCSELFKKSKIFISWACARGNIDLLNLIKFTSKDLVECPSACHLGGNLEIIKMFNEVAPSEPHHIKAACKSGNLETVKYLANKYKLPYHCLESAVEGNNLELIKYLVEKGSVDFYKAMSLAIRTSKVDIVDYLFLFFQEPFATKFFTSELVHKYISEFLKEAVKEKNYDIVKIIIKKCKQHSGKIENIVKDLRITKLFIKHFKVDLGVYLRAAIESKKNDVVKYLLSINAPHTETEYKLACEQDLTAVKHMKYDKTEGMIIACLADSKKVVNLFLKQKIKNVDFYLKLVYYTNKYCLLKVFAKHGQDNGYSLIKAVADQDLDLIKKCVQNNPTQLEKAKFTAKSLACRDEILDYLHLLD